MNECDGGKSKHRIDSSLSLFYLDDEEDDDDDDDDGDGGGGDGGVGPSLIGKWLR